MVDIIKVFYQSLNLFIYLFADQVKAFKLKRFIQEWEKLSTTIWQNKKFISSTITIIFEKISSREIVKDKSL